MLYKYISTIVIIIIILNVAHSSWTEQCLWHNCEVKTKLLVSQVEILRLLRGLKKVFDFAWNNRHLIDISFYTGLFLAQVHLRILMHNSHASNFFRVNLFQKKYKRIPISLKRELHHLILKNRHNIEYFQVKAYSVRNKKQMHLKKILTLFFNEYTWMQMSNVSFKQTWIPDASYTFTPSKYEKFVENLYKTADETTTYKKIEKCFEKMSELEDKFPTWWDPYNRIRKCQTTPRCKNILYHSWKDAVGLMLSRRAMMFMVARNSRLCYLNDDPVHDHLNYTELCYKMFLENVRHATHQFPYVDLTFEQMTVCSFNYHADFFVKSWWHTLFHKQHELGCFPTTKRKNFTSMQSEDKWYFVRHSFDIKNGNCNLHATSFGAAAMAGALRFLVEEAVEHYIY